MTHDPLCRFSRKRAADDKYDDCEYCDLIARVDERALSAQIDHYNNGRDMGIAEARDALIAVPWRTDMAGAVILRADAVAAIDALRSES